MKSWLAVLIFILVLPAHASLVKVTSMYSDETTKGRKLKVSGSGLLFSHLGRLFVFTASHVSQGENTTVELNGVTGVVTGRALSARNDLELLEVTAFAATDVRATFDGTFIRYRTGTERRRWIDSYNYVPLLDFVNDPNLDVDNTFSRGRNGVLSMDSFSALLHGESLVQPGTSGAPLLTEAPTAWSEPLLPYDLRERFLDLKSGETVVRGMAIRRERFFSHASFVPVREILELLELYLQGKAPTPKVNWKAQGALLYRVDLDDHLRETSSFAANTSGGSIVDAGNGVSMDGGDLATLGEDTPREFLAKISAFPTFGDEPQMYWMLAMRHPKTSFLINFWCWFDMEFYQTLSQFMFATHVKEDQQMDLVSQLYPRFNQRKDFEVLQSEYLKVDRAGVLARLKVPGDVLEFQLNRQGIFCAGGVCPDRFTPVIEVPSKSGQTYLIDLHQLFFVDSGRALTIKMREPASVGLGSDERLALIYDALQEETLRPRVMYRKKRANLTLPMTLQEGLQSVIEWNGSAATRPR